MIGRVISGGQTGVDRAALDAALELGIPVGGWCPLGRKAEDGPIPEHYPLTEMPTDAYPARTRRNVDEAGATLILTWGHPGVGTQLTIRILQQAGKGHCIEDLSLAETWTPAAVEGVRFWLHDVHGGETINVAGPRESGAPGVYEAARRYLLLVLK